MIKKLKTAVFYISILLFIASLTQPAFYTSANNPAGWSNSLGLIFFGWSGVLYGGAGIAWFANPLIFASWICHFINKKASVVTATLATVFAASFLLFKGIITGEDGHYSIITDRKAGYWLWLASITIFAIGTIIIHYLEKRPTIDTTSNSN